MAALNEFDFFSKLVHVTCNNNRSHLLIFYLKYDMRAISYYLKKFVSILKFKSILLLILSFYGKLY